MTGPGQPLFLERQSYRRRRLIDASRLIPVFGLCLLLVPLLWPKAEQTDINLAARGIYVFSVWFGLVLATLIVSYRLQARAGEAGPEQGQVDAGAPDVTDVSEDRHVL